MPNLKELAGQVIEAVRGNIERAVAPLRVRVAQLDAAIKAIPAGKDGAPGKDGERGEPGQAGKDGRDGSNGKDGVDGQAGKDGAPGAAGEKGDQGKDGRDGSNGKDGAPGEQGVAGKDGRDGINGKDGAPGTDGLDGKPGERGEKGDLGAVGAAGRSAYESAVERGFKGTELQWLDAMQGRPGKDADAGEIRFLRESIESRTPTLVIAEMVDEVSRGLGGFGDVEEVATVPVLADLAKSVKELNDTMRQPLVPVLDEHGDIIGAQRG